MSGCSNYAENLWKKGKCSNCFRAKEQHLTTGTKDVFHSNGDSRLIKNNHEAPKSPIIKPNQLSNIERQTSSEDSADGGKFIPKGTVKRAGKFYQAPGSEFSKRLSSYQTTLRNDSPVGETQNTALLRDNKGATDSLDKPKLVSSSTREITSFKTSQDSDEATNVRCSAWSSESSITELKTDLHDSKNNVNNANGILRCGAGADVSKEKEISRNKVESDDIKHDQVTKRDAVVNKESIEYENSLISQRKNTRKEKDFTMDSKSVESNGKDGEYMQMKNNVCQGMEDDKKTDVDPNDKIQSANTCESDDNKAKRIINKHDLPTSPNKHNGVKSPNNIITDDSNRPSKVTSGAGHSNHTSTNCDGQETLNLEPHYQNRRSIDSDGRESSSSSSPLFDRPSICSVMSPTDRPESIAFKVQSDLGELRESSIFEDIVVEPIETSSNSDSSKASSSMSSSPVTDTKTSTELQRIKSSNGNGKPFDSHLRPSEQEGIIQRQHSNPDVTKLVEGPCYANADAKPITKPYKVVDISAGVPCNDNEHADTPPLPPKEKELNRQKEDSIPDHYYCEPPDDIVPDYKKLTPQNKKPPPIEIKKDPKNRTPTLPKAGPVPRPRSQLPSHSSTLPRPVPRAVKVEVNVKDVTRSGRPVSQVVTRTHKKEAPKPPSTSSIPSRKNTSDFSPPTSPTGKNSSSSPERSQYQGSSNTVDSKDTTMKPKRMAPPPPKAAQTTGRVSSKKEKQKESPRASPTPSPTGQYQQPDSSQSNKAQSKSGSGIKRALSSWKRLSGRRKNKRKLEISSPILVNEEVESYPAQKEAVERTKSEGRSTSPVCTNIKEVERDSTVLSQNPPEEAVPVVETEVKETQASSSPQLPARQPGRSYQNFPFSKTDIEKPTKPSRPARAVKPVVHVKPEVNQNPMTQSIQHEPPAYLEPCTGELTLKVEAALANLNDAKILAETLTRVEQEKLGPLPEVPRSRHVHFRFNETANKTGKPAPKQSPKRPVTAVAPTVVNRQADMKSRQPRYPSRPPNTKPFASDEKKRSKSVTEQKSTDRTGNPRSRSMSTQDNPVKKRYDKILELHIQTLEDMINNSKAVLLPGDNIDLSNTRWNDYVIFGSAMDIEAPGAVSLPVVCPKVDEELTLLAKVKFPKSVTEDMSQRTAYMQDMAVTVSLPSHPNVSRTITHFTDYLQGEVFGLKNSSDFETLVTITDQVPVESVLEFVERTKEEHRELPDEYERKVCILLIQLFSALVHLHEEGIVHRDIRLNNLVLLDHGHLVLSNFSHVLQNSGGDISPSRFEYSIDSVGHIGRDPCRIPPEIHKAYNCGKLMNYEKCDVFAVGCLIYELLHEKNPFAVDSSLLTQDYTIHDLPMLTETSRFTSGLAALASSLLQRDPQMRMLPGEALKLLQAYLWGPEDLDESCFESSASDWLETERAHAVIMIARTQSHGSVVTGDEFLENFLKYEYLVTLTEDIVLEGYKALAPQTSPTIAASV